MNRIRFLCVALAALFLLAISDTTAFAKIYGYSRFELVQGSDLIVKGTVKKVGKDTAQIAVDPPQQRRSSAPAPS